MVRKLYLSLIILSILQLNVDLVKYEKKSILYANYYFKLLVCLTTICKIFHLSYV